MSVETEITKVRGEMLEIADELRRASRNAWIGTPGWHFNRIADLLRTAQQARGYIETKDGLLQEVQTMRDALLELLPRVEFVLGEGADALERKAVEVPSRVSKAR